MKAIIVGNNEEASISALALSMANETGAELIAMDGSYIEYQKPIKYRSSIMGEEKKKTKPCKAHEYVESVRGDGNAQYSEWKCRHCKHPLK